MALSIASILRDVRVTRQAYVLGFVVPALGLGIWTNQALSGKLLALGTAAFAVPALGWVALFAVADPLNLGRYRDIGQSGSWWKILRLAAGLMLFAAYVLQVMVLPHQAMSGDPEALAQLIGMDLGGFRLAPIPAALVILALAGLALNSLYLSLMPSGAGIGLSTPPERERAAPMPAVAGTAEATASSGGDLAAIIEREAAAYRARTAAAPSTPSAQPAGPGGFGKRRG